MHGYVALIAHSIFAPPPNCPMTIVLGILVALIVVLVLALILYFRFSPRIGSNPAGARLERIRALANYRNGQLHNVVPTDMNMPPKTMAKVMWWMLRGGEGREPAQAIPTVPFDREAWKRVPNDEVALAWFGHSTLLIKMDGITFLTDPVFGERASTFSFAGPKRFAFTEHMRVDQLPQVDVVLLSHDHYDHLCYETITELVERGVRGEGEGVRAEVAPPPSHFTPPPSHFTPPPSHLTLPHFIAALGVGAHLEKWGVPSSSITELEWWQEQQVGDVKLTFTPSRHFTGRSMTNRFSTLWGSFVLQGRSKRIYFGADSGYSPTFHEIGERFGPFDLAMLECGAYSEFWPDIHMFPEETAQAAKDLRAQVLMPIHWAKFALGLHPWKESIERITAKASEEGLPLLTPQIGRIVTTLDTTASEKWWEGLK
jgi:L-ascorbate metabolism protein UlaG (beta-lactamase superfamily)